MGHDNTDTVVPEGMQLPPRALEITHALLCYRRQVLLELPPPSGTSAAAAAAVDLSGDAGAVGRVIIPGGPKAAAATMAGKASGPGAQRERVWGVCACMVVGFRKEREVRCGALWRPPHRGGRPTLCLPPAAQPLRHHSAAQAAGRRWAAPPWWREASSCCR